jgi:predicted Zn-dependent protease
LPDGSLYLTSGLLDALDQPEELAAVLAHEMGHVVNKDAPRLLERLAGPARRIEETGPSDAAACQAAASAAVSSCFMGLSTAPMKALRQVLLSGYGEEAEVQADLFAARVLADAGYDRQALANVLARLQGQKEAPAGAQGPSRQRLLWGLGEKSAGIGVRLERLRQPSAPKP